MRRLIALLPTRISGEIRTYWKTAMIVGSIIAVGGESLPLVVSRG
jgi:hypothetical protein